MRGLANSARSFGLANSNRGFGSSPCRQRNHRAAYSVRRAITCSITRKQHEWRGQSWDATDLWDPAQKTIHLTWLHRISAAEGPLELVTVLTALSSRAMLTHPKDPFSHTVLPEAAQGTLSGASINVIAHGSTAGHSPSGSTSGSSASISGRSASTSGSSASTSGGVASNHSSRAGTVANSTAAPAVAVTSCKDDKTSTTTNPSNSSNSSHRPPMLTPLVLSTCLQRLAEYKLSEAGLFTSHIATLPEFPSVVSMLQSQLTALCRMQPHAEESRQEEAGQKVGASHVDGNVAPPWYHVSIRCMAEMLWALITLLKPLDPEEIYTSLGPRPKGLRLTTATAYPSSFPIEDNADAGRSSNPEPSSPGVAAAGALLGETLAGVAAWAASGREGGEAGAAGCAAAEISDLVCLLSAYGALMQRAREQGTQVTPAAAVMDSLCARLAGSLQDVVTGEEMEAEDLADVAQALAATRHRSPAVASLIHAVAHEVYRQINNRNSFNVPFFPHDLVKLLRAYAQLQVMDVGVCRMLDAIAGYTCKLIRKGHVMAIHRPDDIAAMLHAYADLQHDSVAIPELVFWTAYQQSGEIGSEYLRSSPRPGPSPDVILSLLTGYQRLGFYPGPDRVTTLLLPVADQVEQASGATLAGLLEVLAQLQHDPGRTLCHAMARKLHERWQLGEASAMHLAQGLVACAALDHPPGPLFLEDVCRACLYQDETDEQDEAGQDQQPGTQPASRTHARHEGRFLSGYPDSALTCQLLFALVVCEGVTMRRFGMACAALRHSGGRLRDEALGLVAAAAVMLGEEGWEMAEEVLPQGTVARMRTAMGETVERWASDLRGLAGLSEVHETTATAFQRLGAIQATHASLEVLGCVVPLPVFQATCSTADTHPSNGNSQTSTSHTLVSDHRVSHVSPSSANTCLVVVEPLLAGEMFANCPYRPLGTARLRQRLVERLWLDSLCSQPEGITNIAQGPGAVAMAPRTSGPSGMKRHAEAQNLARTGPETLHEQTNGFAGSLTRADAPLLADGSRHNRSDGETSSTDLQPVLGRAEESPVGAGQCAALVQVGWASHLKTLSTSERAVYLHRKLQTTLAALSGQGIMALWP